MASFPGWGWLRFLSPGEAALSLSLGGSALSRFRGRRALALWGTALSLSRVGDALSPYEGQSPGLGSWDMTPGLGYWDRLLG
jgi:hypothetical protein